MGSTGTGSFAANMKLLTVIVTGPAISVVPPEAGVSDERATVAEFH
jgi:hypothetical protein